MITFDIAIIEDDGRCTVTTMDVLSWKRCPHKANQLASKGTEKNPVCRKHNCKLKKCGFQINELVDA